MTLNSVTVTAVILHYFTKFGSFVAKYVTVVEVTACNRNVAHRVYSFCNIRNI